MVAKNNEKTTSKKEIIISIFFAMLFIGLVGALVVANFRINSRRDEMMIRIDQLKKDIKSLEDKNQQLNKNLNQANSADNLEKVAREQLGLKKPGEEVVVVKNQNAVTDENTQTTTAPQEPAKKNPWDPRNWWGMITGR